MLDDLNEEVENFGNFPTYYIGLVTDDDELEHYDGKLRIKDQNGVIKAECIDPKNL